MNCKPGDLAVYIGPCPVAHGLIRKIVEPHPVFYGAWLVEPPYPPGGVGSEIAAWDANLRPIRDPGDDAQDETLSWRPVPTKEGMPA